MKIKLTSPHKPDYKSEIYTEQFVEISDVYIGPTLVNYDVCLSVFARDGGFEGYCWKGEPGRPDDTVPLGATAFQINPQDVVLGFPDTENARRDQWRTEAVAVILEYDRAFEMLPDNYKLLGRSKASCIAEYIKHTKVYS